MLAEGLKVPEVAKHRRSTRRPNHRWRAQYVEHKAHDVERLKELETENARLKRIVAEKEFQIGALKKLGEQLVGPARRRRAVTHAQRVFAVSQRWACQLVRQHRSTQGHQPIEPDRNRTF